ncbi:MAG: hypothetical protein KKA51_05530 [Nanoarchaeota archaeon]|nr:hypothetical protein [Nanoarchaeota archaeon]
MELMSSMFIDVAIPNNNEEAFISFAKKIGTKELIFLYEKEEKKNFEKIKKLNTKEFLVFTAITRQQSKKYDYNFSTGSRNDFENKSTDYVYEIEKDTKKDNYHYRQSGLNQVLCALAKEKDITIAFSFNLLLTSKNKETVLGKMMQNARLCNKYKVKTIVASFARKPNELRNEKDLSSFGAVLGLKP